MNSYEVCKRHENGHLPYCCLCQEESLRDLLRQVANSPIIIHEDIVTIVGETLYDRVVLSISSELWIQIASLREKAPMDGKSAHAFLQQAHSENMSRVAANLMRSIREQEEVK